MEPTTRSHLIAMWMYHLQVFCVCICKCKCTICTYFMCLSMFVNVSSTCILGPYVSWKEPISHVYIHIYMYQVRRIWLCTYMQIFYLHVYHMYVSHHVYLYVSLPFEYTPACYTSLTKKCLYIKRDRFLLCIYMWI